MPREINAQFVCVLHELLLMLEPAVQLALTCQLSMHRLRTLNVKDFILGQKWRMTDPIFGTFIGEVIKVSEDGAAGTVLITDDQGNEVNTFAGTAAEFQASGEWRLEE